MGTHIHIHGYDSAFTRSAKDQLSPEQAREQYKALKAQAEEASKSSTGKLRLQGLIEKMRALRFQFGSMIADAKDIEWEELFDSATGDAYNDPEKVKARYFQLKAKGSEELRQLVKQNYRIVDVKGVDKESLVMMMMEAEFGRKAIEAAFP